MRTEGGKVHDGIFTHFADDVQSILGAKVDAIRTGEHLSKDFFERIQGDQVLLYEEGKMLCEPVFVPEELRRSSYLSDSQRDVIILRRILMYIKQANDDINQLGDDYSNFLTNVTYRNAIAMNVFQIGEHTKRLSDEFRQSFKDMPWISIKAMRNIIAYEYYDLDIPTLWEIMQHHIPILQKVCSEALAKLENKQEQKGD